MDELNLSRRNFLKMLGFGGAIAAFSMAANFSPQSITRFTQEANAVSSGSWSLGPNLSYPYIHVQLLKNGKVMTTPGSGWQQSQKNGPFRVGVFDPTTSVETLSTTPDDLFCCGFAQMADGNVLITGGTTSYADGPDGRYHGGDFAYLFDVDTGTFHKINSMAHGRWYPSMGTLPDGKVYIMNGFDELGAVNNLTEIYDPITKTFSIKYDPNSSITYCVGTGNNEFPEVPRPCYGGSNKGVNPNQGIYARTIILPNGYVYMAGQLAGTRLWRPSTGVWYTAGNMQFGRSYGTAVLLPMENTTSERGKVLIAGGQQNSSTNVLKTAEIADFTGKVDPHTTETGSLYKPSITQISQMTYARMYPNPVILPTGEVILFGGTSGDNVNFVFHPELFDPITNDWTVLPPSSIGRQYHSNAILLPDGRIWIVSGTPGMTAWEPRTDFFSPSYMSASRPTISGAPTVGTYGGTISIPTPDAGDITKVSLVRLTNSTHHFDAEHRLVWLQIQSNSGSTVVVNAPINSSMAPPGYYMIHILKNGSPSKIPSQGKIIKIGPPSASGGDTVPPTVSINSPAARAGITGPSGGVPVTISGSAYDANSGVSTVKISVDSGPEISAVNVLSNYSLWALTTNITTQGPHKIRAKATDNAGNSSTTEIPINVFFS